MADYGSITIDTKNEGNKSTRSLSCTPILIQNSKSRNHELMNRSATNLTDSSTLKEAERVMRESVSQMVKERLKKGGSFGIEGYSLPSYNPQHKQHFGFKKWSVNKIPNMYDIIRKKAMLTPSPDKYTGQIEHKVPKNYAGFSKVKRITYIDNIIPAPNHYEVNYLKPNKTFYSSKSSSGNAFIDEAVFRGKETPGFYKVKFDCVEKRCFKYKMSKSKKGNFLDYIKIQKIAPGVGHYDSMKSFDKTQKSRVTLYLPRKKHETCTDEIVNIKKFIPGVGKYNTENTFKRLSKHSDIRKGRFG